MKVAYIFCGHSRTWDKCHRSFFDNIYNVFPGDIFLHTWNKVNARSGSWWNSYEKEILDPELQFLSSQLSPIEQIKEIYKPIFLTVEEDPSWNDLSYNWAKDKYSNRIDFNNPITIPKLGIKFVLEALSKTLDKVISHANYDRIFCTRLDLLYLNRLDPSEFTIQKLIVSKTRFSSLDFIQDIFFHGIPDIVKSRIELYNHIDNIWYDKNFIDIDYEIALTEYLKQKNIPISESSLKFQIPRINGSVSVF